MKVLIANKFHSRRGGDCIYSLNLQAMLEQNGHEVAFFAMQHPKNLPSKWEKYFPSEIVFSPQKPLQFIKAIFRPFFSFEVWWKFRNLLNDFQPNVVHLNNIHSQLSPLIAKMAHDRGIRVVWTLHDYKLLCPRYDCLKKGRICEFCYTNKIHVVVNSCLKGSRLGSVIAYLEAKLWSKNRLESISDVFICPSHFMKAKMIQGGFDSEKLKVLHNFVDESKVIPPFSTKAEHYCYVGRLSEEKGIRTLLDAASKLPYNLKILGTGPLDDELRTQYQKYTQIEFLGHCDWPIIKHTLASAKCMVLPSEWYENCPLSALESMALGTSIIGANIGGIPELLQCMKSNLLFESGNSHQLTDAINRVYMTNETNGSFVTKGYYEELKSLYESSNFEN